MGRGRRLAHGARLGLPAVGWLPAGCWRAAGAGARAPTGLAGARVNCFTQKDRRRANKLGNTAPSPARHFRQIRERTPHQNIPVRRVV